MSKVVREDIDSLHAVLTFTIGKEDYAGLFKEELGNYRKKATLKGFRKGKTPASFVRKMYGQSILTEVVFKLIQTEVDKYIKENNLSTIGQPIPAEDQELMEFDVNEAKDYVFKFEIGLVPEFEITGLDTSTEVEKYAVEVPSDQIEERLEEARKQVGTRASVEDTILENDMVVLNMEELDGDQVKENGWATTTTLLVKAVAEPYKTELLDKKKGDKIRFKVSQLEGAKDEGHVRKYLLNVEESDEDIVIGDDFEAVISDVTRLEPAELNQEFFDKVFGEGNVSNEEEAKEKIGEQLAKTYESSADALLFRDIQDTLLEKNKFDLPETFLKRWLKSGDENVSDEQLEKEFEPFLQNLRWTFIRSKVSKEANIEVTEDEIFEGMKERIRGYFGAYGDELIILNTANRLMEDKEQVNQMFQEMETEKVIDHIKSLITVKDNPVTLEQFEEVVKEANARMAPPEEVSATEETEEEVTEEA